MDLRRKFYISFTKVNSCTTYFYFSPCLKWDRRHDIDVPTELGAIPLHRMRLFLKVNFGRPQASYSPQVSRRPFLVRDPVLSSPRDPTTLVLFLILSIIVAFSFPFWFANSSYGPPGWRQLIFSPFALFLLPSAPYGVQGFAPCLYILLFSFFGIILPVRTLVISRNFSHPDYILALTSFLHPPFLFSTLARHLNFSAYTRSASPMLTVP